LLSSVNIAAKSKHSINMENALGKILVVDDEQDIVEFITYNLERAGYEVAKAYNGDEAIYKAGRFNRDLILLDVMMPEKDGHQTIQQLRRNPALDNTIIIFLTALGDEKSEIEGLKLGADDYIAKPIKPDLLLARLRTALRRMKKDEEQGNKIVFGELE